MNDGVRPGLDTAVIAAAPMAMILSDIVDRNEEKSMWALLESAIEMVSDATIIIDADQRIAAFNRPAEEMFAYARKDVLGQAVDMLAPEHYTPAHANLVAKFLADPSTRTMGAGRELFGRRSDGTQVPIEVGMSSIGRNGVFVVASIVDVSERIRAEAVREHLAAIVENSDDAIIGKSLEGVITSWNKAAERLFGHTAEEAIGQPILLIVPAKAAAEEAGLLERLRRNEQIAHYETLRRHKDGTDVDVSVTLSPIRDRLGSVIGVASIARDITELTRYTAELKRSNVELERFAYVAAHDMQEPLRTVANYTELLGERYAGKLDAKADTYIHLACDGARRMQKLVSDVLAYSRVGSQGRPLMRISADAVLRSVLELLGRLVSEAGARVEFEALPTVLADEVQLRQLFQNLISNAILFRSEAPPKIVVTAAPDGNYWRFSIADNGIGIDMQFAGRLFQMFQRVHGRGKYEGSGIGLAIAKQIVERHGGRIWVESQPGAGATFFFTLQRGAHHR